MKELVLDVSRWDEGINLQAWKALHGLWGVICKAGGNEGGRYTDRAFAGHYNSAVAAGLHVGAYYYTTAIDADEAAQDARHCLEIIGSRSLDLPIYIDVEDAGQTAIGRRRLTDVCLAFIRTIEAAGHRGGVYTSGSWWQNYVYADELRPYANWIAWWTANRPSVISDVGMWQFGCMRMSDGDVVHDDVGGYTDANYCYVDYPNEGKGSDGRVKVSIADIAARIHYDMVTDERNGYSQYPDRWGGDYGGTKTVTVCGRSYTYKLGSYDCSSSTITAWRLALQGTPYEGALDGATYTGDMRSVFVGSGLFYADYSPAKRGDLYLAEGKHVAMCQDGGSDGVFGYDCLSEFNRNENGGAQWGEPGDQDGHEAVIREYYDDGWNTVLHYNGKADYYIEEEKVKPKQDAGKPKNDFGLKYNAHVADVGWLDVVRDGQTAGTVGYGKRLEAITVNPPAGWELRFKLHIANVGWKVFSGIAHGNETVIGTVGKGNAIECMIVDVTKHPEGDKRKLYFQVHQANLGWKGATPQGFSSGTDGMGIQLEAVRIWVG